MPDPFAPLAEPPADRFRPRDWWTGPDRRLYRVRPCSVAPGLVSLVDATGRHELMGARQVVGFTRQRWGGAQGLIEPQRKPG